MFVALEGIDGSGKTTVANLLGDRQRGSYMLRTPGHTLTQIRDLVLNPNYNLDHDARLLFFLAEMVDLGKNVIAPRRDSGLVITDRFYLSTYVYQVMMRLHELSISKVNLFFDIFDLLLPNIDHTFILTVDIETAQNRAKGHHVEFSKKDVFEAADAEAWERRKSYYDTAKDSPIARKLGQVTYINTEHITAIEVVEEIERVLGL